MSSLWGLLGLAAIAAIARTIAWSSARRSDLGCVSRHWLAEQHF
jgi:hypothetical protein